MLSKKLILYLITIVIMMLTILAIQIINFDGQPSSKNLTFTGNENQTLNLILYRYANVTSATMNLSGFNNYTWEINTTIDDGLYQWGNAYLTFFILDSNYNVIIGESNGRFFGYTWDDDSWVSNATIDNGLFDQNFPSVYTTPSVFELNNNMYLIHGRYEGNFTGYNWTGNSWQIDNNIIGGLGTLIYQFTTPRVFNLDNLTHLITGRDGGSFVGYTWDGDSWVSNTTIDNGLYSGAVEGTRSSPSIFELNGIMYFITGNWSSNILKGYNWTGNSWQIDNNIVSGVIISNNKSNPSVFELNNNTFLISGTGASGGVFDSYKFRYLVSSDSYPTNNSILLNNTQIWNYTGEFNQTNNKTSDFSSILNTALNGGLCNCIGCLLDGDNCNINFTFHSDTAGILQVSALSVNYSMPTVNQSTLNNSWSNTLNTSFTCNSSTDNGETLKNVTIRIYNSTSLINSNSSLISGTTNSTSLVVNVSNDGNYTWDCLVYDASNTPAWTDSNYTIKIDTTSPIVNILSPANNTIVDGAIVTLTYSITDESNISNCYFRVKDIDGIINNGINNQTLDCGGTSKNFAVDMYYNFTLEIFGEDSAGNINNSILYFSAIRSSVSGLSTGGGGGGSTTKVTVIAIIVPDILNTDFTDLQRAIVYSKINELYEIDKNLNEGDINLLINNLAKANVFISFEDAESLIFQYSKNEIENVDIENSKVELYGLIKVTTVIEELEFKVNPRILSGKTTLVCGSKNIELNVKGNQVFKECIGFDNFLCSLESPTKAVVSYDLKNSDFFVQALTGEVRYVSINGDVDKTIIKSWNVINYCAEIDNTGIPILITIILIILFIVIFIKRRNLIKFINRV